jgi:hypothetical protein
VKVLLHQWNFDELPIIIRFSSIFEVMIWLKFARKRNTAINIANCKSTCSSLEGIFCYKVLKVEIIVGTCPPH